MCPPKPAELFSIVPVVLAVLSTAPKVASQEHTEQSTMRMVGLLMPRLLRSEGLFPVLNSPDVQSELELTAEQIDNIERLKRSSMSDTMVKAATARRQIDEMDDGEAEGFANRIVVELRNLQTAKIMDMLDPKQRLRLKQIRLQELIGEQRRISRSDLKSVDVDVELDDTELKRLNVAMAEADALVRAEMLDASAFYLADPLSELVRMRRLRFVEAWKVVLGERNAAALLGQPFNRRSSLTATTSKATGNQPRQLWRRTNEPAAQK